MWLKNTQNFNVLLSTREKIIKNKYDRNLLCEEHMLIIDRSSRPEVFCEKGVLINFAKFTGKQLYQSLSFNKAAGGIFTEHLWWLLLDFYSLKDCCFA